MPARPTGLVVARVVAAAILIACGLATSVARAGAGARIRKGPYLQDLGSTSVEIRAELDAPAAVAITLSPHGADAGGARTVRDSRTGSMHVVRIDGLSPATRYDYVLEAGDASARGELTTAPPDTSTDPFTFLAYGDNRSDDVAHAAIIHQMLQTPSDFLIHTGDYVQSGESEPMWQTFFDIESTLVRDRCVFGCVGNHELIDGASGNYLRYFGPVSDARGAGDEPKLYGSFRWASARFFLLDAMEGFDTGPERAWLDDELTRADAENVAWRIVVLHQAPWSAGPHGGNPRLLSAGIPALFSRHHIDLVLAGHDHIYERGFASGLPYVITGGGGAPLYPIDHPLPSTRKAESVHHFVELTVSPAAIALVATRDDGSVFDRCALDKGHGDWDCDPKAPPSVERATPVPSRASTARCACDVVGASRGEGEPWWTAGLGLFALAFARRGRLQ